MFDRIVAFLNDHVLFMTFVFLGIFILSEIYLVPEDMRFGKGDVKNFKMLKEKMKELKEKHFPKDDAKETND